MNEPTLGPGGPVSADATAMSVPVDTAPRVAGAPAPPGAAPSEAREAITALRAEIGKVVVGQDGVLSGLVAALLVRGHVLLEGVPGVAKTLLVKSLAAAMDLDFHRVQFTPDLMPSDVTGQSVLDTAGGSMRFRPGPVFTNLLLADEINRTPPKTQAALLESMEERQVTVEGLARPLPDPFVVVATENPIEHEGTYPLPEAQLDRFLVKLVVGYPSFEDECRVLQRHHGGFDPHDVVAAGVRPVVTRAHLDAARAEVAAVVVEPAVIQYIVAVCRATREHPAVETGVSPRGAAALLAVSKAWAWMLGRPYLTPAEVVTMATPTLRHRLVVRPELELEGVGAEGVLGQVLATVPSPR